MSTQKTIRYTRKKGKKRFNYECEVISTPFDRRLRSRIPKGAQHLETIVETKSVEYVVDNQQSYEQPKDHTYNPNSDAPKQKTIRSADDLPKSNRYGQKKFREKVTVGEACIFCDSPAHRLDAAHAVSWADTKNMHPANGLPMCKNHHAHYDIGNIIIDWHDGYTVYSQTTQLIPMHETRDRMSKHLDELSKQSNKSLDELLQQQRTHIEANVKKQMEENEWVDEHKWKIYS